MQSTASRLLAFLESAGIAFAASGSCRSASPYPSGDLDLTVRAEDVERVRRLAYEFVGGSGGRLIRAVATAGGGCCLFFARLDESGPVKMLVLDLHTRLAVGGRVVAGAEEILRTRRGFRTSPGLEFAYTLLKAQDRPEIASRLRALWNEDEADVRREIARRWPDLKDEIERSTRAGLAATVLKRPARHRWQPGRALRRLIRPTGCSIAFLGVDGSGKSSLIRALKEIVSPAFPHLLYRHFKPNLLGKVPQPASRAVQFPSSVRPGFSLQGLRRLAYYLFDYTVGYAVKVWPRLLTSGLVIFDRHFLDLSVDPIRLRHRLPMALAAGAARLIPAPDLVFVVDTPAPVALSRKPVGPPREEVERQRAAYVKLAERNPDIRILDGERPSPELARVAASLILEALDAREVRRLGWDASGQDRAVPVALRAERPSSS